MRKNNLIGLLVYLVIPCDSEVIVRECCYVVFNEFVVGSLPFGQTFWVKVFTQSIYVTGLCFIAGKLMSTQYGNLCTFIITSKQQKKSDSVQQGRCTAGQAHQALDRAFHVRKRFGRGTLK
jgi:hypothetical protein